MFLYPSSVQVTSLFTTFLCFVFMQVVGTLGPVPWHKLMEAGQLISIGAQLIPGCARLEVQVVILHIYELLFPDPLPSSENKQMTVLPAQWRILQSFQMFCFLSWPCVSCFGILILLQERQSTCYGIFYLFLVPGTRKQIPCNFPHAVLIWT